MSDATSDSHDAVAEMAEAIMQAFPRGSQPPVALTRDEVWKLMGSPGEPGDWHLDVALIDLRNARRLGVTSMGGRLRYFLAEG